MNVSQKMNMSHAIKSSALKRRCVEIESEVTKLGETVLLSEEKKKIERRKIILSLTTYFCLKVNFVS